MKINKLLRCNDSIAKAGTGFLALFIISLFFVSTNAFAAADWEWSQDKGWAQSSGRALPNPAEQLKYAYKLEKEGRFLNASKQYFLLLKSFPDSDEAGVGLQRLANCLFMMENYYDAYKALEQVIKSYPFSAEKSDLIKIEFLIGRKFQAGSRVNLLDDNEDPAVGKRAAIEIFESVVANDSVGPYAGASLLAIASCYKDLDEPARGIVYADRVLTEFSMSSELVAKARIMKKTMEVMLGNADINSVRAAVSEAKKAAAEDETQGDADFAPVDNYDSEIRELEEIQAKKLWDSAEYYRKRGTRDSTVAYKFSLEQIMVRFPNTSYASKARRIIGDVEVPKKKERAGKFNIPFITKKPPTFLTASNSDDYVHSDDVPVPGIDSDIPDEDIVAAVALPKGNSEVPMGQDYATPKTNNGSKNASESQEGGFGDFGEEDITFEDEVDEDIEDDFVDPTSVDEDEFFEESEEEITERVQTEPVVQTKRGPIAPVGAGASAVPMGAAMAPQSRPNYSSETEYTDTQFGSDDPFGSSPDAPAYDTAPESVKTQTSASAIPMSMRRDSSIMEKAQSKARVKANESAADSNDWSFSEEF